MAPKDVKDIALHLIDGPGLGWEQDPDDTNDLALECKSHAQNHEGLPKKLNLFSSQKELNPYASEYGVVIPPRFQQGLWPSCVACAVAGAYHYLYGMENPHVADEDPFTPSIQWVWYWAKYYKQLARGKTPDVAASNALYPSVTWFRAALKGLSKKGVAIQSDWEYPAIKDINPELKQVPPPPEDKVFATVFSVQYTRVTSPNNDINCVRDALASGWPVMFSFFAGDQGTSENPKSPLAKAFWKGVPDSEGMVLMEAYDGTKVGGHAALAYGYDDEKGCIMVRNCWGEDKDYWMPYDHLLCMMDFWTIRATPIDDFAAFNVE